MRIARGTRCHGSRLPLPLDVSLVVRSFARYRPWTFIYDARRIRMRNARLNARGDKVLSCALEGVKQNRVRSTRGGFSLPELWGQTFDAGNVYLGHSVREQITRNFCAIDVSGTECVRSVQICVFHAALRMKRKC